MLILSDDRMIDHDPGPGHPECPARLEAVTAALREIDGLTWRSPRAAGREHIVRVHTEAHVDRVNELRGKRGSFDADTCVSPASVEAAYLAAGAAIEAVEEVLHGEHDHAFALVRPPGHHAEAHAAMGFCLFNNIAVAAEHALSLGCERVLIVDWDVHHGNGTQHSFLDRNDVLFCSLHQFPFYPGTGALDETGSGAGEGYTINIPMLGGLSDGDYVKAFTDVLVPVADEMKPDLVLVSAGFDAHRDDPLAMMRVTEDGYAAMAAIVKDIADRHANGRVVLSLEGGYDLDALGRSARACVRALQGDTPPEIGAAHKQGEAIIERVAQQHRNRWSVLGS